MFKKMLNGILLATLIASLLLAACSPAAPTAPDATQEPGSDPVAEPVTIEYWTFVEFANAQATIDAVAAFEAANPGITVDVVGKPDTEITAGVIVGASSGELPDVFTIAFNTGQEMLKAGALKDISQEWNALPDDYKNQFAPGPVAALNQDGKVYGIPYTAYSTILYRNLTVLRNAGIDPELGIKDWADFLDQMEKVNAAGFTSLPNYSVDGWLVMHFLGGVEGLVNDVVDGKTTISEAQLTEAYQFMQDIAPYGSLVGPFDQAATDLFIQNQMAFFAMGDWMDPVFVAAMETNPDFAYDYVLMPGENEGYSGGVHGGEFFAITPGDNSDAAFKFAVFMADKAQVISFSEDFSGRATYNNAAMSDPTFADYPLLALTVEAASMGMADAAYFAPFPLSVRKPIADNAASVVAGEMTPEEAARAAIDAINAEIADAE